MTISVLCMKVYMKQNNDSIYDWQCRKKCSRPDFTRHFSVALIQHILCWALLNFLMFRQYVKDPCLLKYYEEKKDQIY